MASLLLFANKIELIDKDSDNLIKIYQLMLDLAIKMDYGQLEKKIGKIYLKHNNYGKARYYLEQAFLHSPVESNYEIRITLCELYKTLNLP